MEERDDPRRPRAEKLEELRALGLPLLPNRFGPTLATEEVREGFADLEGTRVCVAGRLMRVRLMGKAAFAHVQDTSGQLQLYFKRDDLGDTKYEYFKLLDLGDIIGAAGTVFKTRTGEVSIHVDDVVLLAKAYRPMPDKFHGISDVEMRYRRRYLDLIANPETRHTFVMRSRIVSEIRRFLEERGFLEVETPTLQVLYGGGAATPFTTRYETLDLDVFLRIATELYLKRLIIGGLDRVFEIGKDFRNEGFSRKHSPEFTMLELYEAYADYDDIMRLCEDVFVSVADRVLGARQVHFDDHEIDLTPPWRRLTIVDALREVGGIVLPANATREDVAGIAAGSGVSFEPGASRGKIIEELVSTLVEPKLVQPTFLIDYPVDFPGSLLAKRRTDDPSVVERFELYMGAMELANAFTELNDPFDQRERMQEAVKLRGEEHQEVDVDFLRALEQGMPPTGGIGIGIDRMVMIMTGQRHIREVIAFPLLRPREDDDA